MTRHIASSLDGSVQYFRVEHDAGDGSSDTFYWCCQLGHTCSKHHPDIDSTFAEGARHIKEFHRAEA